MEKRKPKLGDILESTRNLPTKEERLSKLLFLYGGEKYLNKQEDPKFEHLSN